MAVDKPKEELDLSKRDLEGRRILLAAEKNRLLELWSLIKEDITLVHYRDEDGYTPLHRASYGGNKDCAKCLLRYKAKVDARTSDYWTPLHCAVRWNNIDIAELLIKNGADINAKSNGGNTPLHIAATNGRYSVTCDIIQLLLYNPNCDYSIKNGSGDTAYDITRRGSSLHRLWVGVMTLFPNEEDQQAALVDVTEREEDTKKI